MINLLGHIVVLMARSRMQKEHTAIVRAAVRAASVWGVKNMCVILSAFEKASMPKTVAIRPPTMNGRRLPYLLVQRSLTEPMMGATMRPERGPATQTPWLRRMPEVSVFSK